VEFEGGIMSERTDDTGVMIQLMDRQNELLRVIAELLIMQEVRARIEDGSWKYGNAGPPTDVDVRAEVGL
jgi:hypothetical protein